MPVVIFDRNINGEAYTARIGVNDVGLGKSAAHYARHILGEGAKAIEIYGLRGSTPAEGRHEGFAAEFVGGGGKLLASEAGNWNQDEAMAITDSLLKIYPDVDLIYAHNDRMAIGASQVARRHGRADIKIIGIDAAPEIGIQAVADSVIDATFLYPTEGHRLIRTALAILKGEPYNRETILPTSSAVDLTNADILLLQNESSKEETGKMKILKARIDDYWARHSSQTSLFYASVAIIILLFGVAFLLLRAYWQHSRHQKELMAQNKLLEEERDKQKQLNEQLNDATQSKLMFFTNVSHDLRTPLTLIAEPVTQLAAANNLTPQQHTLIRIADKNVRILQRLINQILDFRKYENGKLNLRLAEIDFDKAVNDWMESFYAIARKRDIKLTLSSPNAGTTLPIALDSEKIERVFFNLLSNAFKYTPDNGSIAVSYSCDGNMLTFKVADTGEGISERDLGNIFDRFYQVDRIHPKGSGIGLSLAKAFVELHGGTISVESALNKGSVFTVTLPVTHVADSTADASKYIDNQVGRATPNPPHHRAKWQRRRDDGGALCSRPHNMRRDDARYGRPRVLPAHQGRDFDIAHTCADAHGVLYGRAEGAGVRQRCRRVSVEAIQQRRAQGQVQQPYRQPQTYKRVVAVVGKPTYYKGRRRCCGKEASCSRRYRQRFL